MQSCLGHPLLVGLAEPPWHACLPCPLGLLFIAFIGITQGPGSGSSH